MKGCSIFGKLVIIFLIITSLLPIQTLAATLTWSTDGLGASYTSNAGDTFGGSKGEWYVDTGDTTGRTLVGVAAGKKGLFSTYAVKATLTITNNTTTSGTLSFDIVTSNCNSLTVGSTEYKSGGSYSGTLAAGASINVVLTTAKNTTENKATLKSIKLESADAVSITFLPSDESACSYTVNGQIVNTSISNSYTAVPALTVTYPDTYKFIGWQTTDGVILGNDETTFPKPNAAVSVKPIFAPADAATYLVNGTYYYYWNDAITASVNNSNATVILVSSGTLPNRAEQNKIGTYVVKSESTDGSTEIIYKIPANVKFLIPYDGSHSESFGNPDTGHAIGNPGTAYQTLTLESGTFIECEGSLCVNARQNSTSVGQTGHVSGNYGLVRLVEGSGIKLLTGSTLYCYGYITGQGTVTAENGSSVHELFQMQDWRGGTVIRDHYSAMKNDSFLLSQFYMQNIETMFTVKYGASVIEHIGIAAGLGDWKTPYQATLTSIGTTGLFALKENGYLVRQYSKTDDRVTYELYGESAINRISLTVDTGLGSVTMDSADYVLNVPSSISIKIKPNATVEVPNRIKLLPDTVLEIEDKGTLKLTSGTDSSGNTVNAELILYDYDDWVRRNYSWGKTFIPLVFSPTRTKTMSLSGNGAQLIVDGTLNVGNGAAVYSTNDVNTANGNTCLSGAGQIIWGTAPTNLRTSVKELLSNSSGAYEDAELGTTYPTVPVVLLQAPLSGLSASAADYTKSMSHSNAYYGLGSAKENYWYQHAVYESVDNTVTITSDKQTKGTALNAYDTTEGDVIGYAANNGVITFTINGCTASIGSTPLTPDASGTYTHTVTADTTITVTDHDWVGPTCTQAEYCSVCQKTGDAALGHDIQPDFHWNEDYTCTAAYNCAREGCDAAGTPSCDVKQETIKEASCTEDGSVKHTASFSVDGNTYSDEKIQAIPALGHDYDSVVTAPTCTAGGYTTHTCANCGDSYTDSETEAVGHDSSTVIPAVAPTCTTTGLTEGRKCSKCGEIQTAQQTVSALGHTEVVDEEVAATCKNIGLTEGKHCSVCNEILVAQTVIAKLDHTEETVAAVAPTCTAAGLTEGKKCSVCGETLAVQEVVAALGHTEVTDAAVAPTCSETGLTEGTHCSVCGETIVAQEVVAALGHTEVIDAAVAASCTENGLTEGSHCSVCGEVIVAQTVIPAGHTWNESGVCSVCGAVCEHDEKYDTEGTCGICGKGCEHQYAESITEPTCTEQGYTTYTCAVCANAYTDTYVSAKGHRWNEATCTAPKTCSVCNITEGEKAAHTYTVEVTAPTCTEAGCTTHTCSVCGDTYTSDVVAATGHIEDTPVKENEVAAGCENGSYDSVVYCTVCDAEVSRETVTVPGTGHSYGDWEITTPATCLEQGEETRTCSACGKTETQSIAATGHSHDAVVTAPTCTQKGYTTYTCAVCGHSYTAEKVDAAGHNYVDGVCTVCGATDPASWFDLYATNVKVTDGLDIFFYVNKDHLDSSDLSQYQAEIKRYKACYDDTSRGGPSETTTYLPFADWTSYSSQYYRFCYSGIAAKEMTDTVTVTIYKDGHQVSNPVTESIESYTLRALNNELKKEETARDAKLLTILVDMLNYGTAAQENFAYNTADPANAQISEHQGYATQSVSYADSDDMGSNLAATSVTVENKLTFTFYFKNITPDAGTVAHFSYEENGKTYTKEVTEYITASLKDGTPVYGWDMAGLTPADGRTSITCVVEQNGTEIASGTRSIENYVAKTIADMQAADANADVESTVYMKLMKFITAAIAYFN